MVMFNRRKDNQGVWALICLKQYHPLLFESIQEEREFQQPHSKIIKHIEPINDEISVLSNSILGNNEVLNRQSPSISKRELTYTPILRRKKRRVIIIIK